MTGYDTPSDTPLLEYKISTLEEKNKALDEQLKREQEEFRKREEDLRTDKEEGLRREQELREIIKNQTLILEDKRTQQSKNTVSPQVLWVFLPVCVIITAIPIIAWLLLDFLKQ